MTITDHNPVTPFLDGDSVGDTHQHNDDSDLQNALDALNDATPAYQEAEDYYTGQVQEFFASRRLQRALLANGNPYRINFAKKPVDAVTEKLKITAVSCPDNPDAHAALQVLWDRNQMGIQSKNMLRRAGEYGDAYIYVWPGEIADDGTVTGVDMFYNSPHCARVFYDPENPLKPVMGIKKWTDGDRVRVNLLYPDRIEKYRSEPTRTHTVTARDLKPYDDPDDADADATEDGWLVNPFDELPMYHLHNDDPYGTPEHAEMYGVQDILTKLIVGHMTNVDYYQAPQRYALADPDVDGSDAEDDDFGMGSDTIDDEDSAGDDPQSQLSADPGSVWLLRGMKSVGQFDVADPKGFTDPMLIYLRFGAQVTDIPVDKIDPTGAAQSGDSRRILRESFYNKLEDRQARYGYTFKAALKGALKMLGFDDVDVAVTWAPIQSIDDIDGWGLVRAKIDAGMPPAQAFLQAGCTDDQVEEWFPEDGEESWLLARADILLKVGQAIKELGVASGFQLIDPKIIRGLVDVLLAKLDEDAAQETGTEPTEQQKPAAPPAAVDRQNDIDLGLFGT